MSALITSDFSIPNNIANGIFKKAQTSSVLARLAGATPQKFGTQQTWILTAPPKAEIVGEGGQKSPTPTTYAPKTIVPTKLQVTMRFSDELKWADEDYQMGVLADMAENAGIALGRALDLVGIHKINPLTGTVASSVTSGLIDCTGKSVVSNGAYDTAIESATGIVISNGYQPTGLAMDPALSFGLATMKDADKRRLYPELGLGLGVTSFLGINSAVGDTVSAKNEIAVASDLLGIVGQFDAFRWGVQRDISAHLIEAGDPDGLGDLGRQNQVAIRAEIVYGIGILDENAFAKVMSA